MIILFDIEGNLQVNGTSSRVHCIAAQDWDTQEVYSFTDASPDYPSLREGLELLDRADYIVAHNAIGYDVPTLRRVFSWTPKAKVVDTLVASMSIFAHRKELDFGISQLSGGQEFPAKYIGRHSLESWGVRLGLHKTQYEGPWENWSEEMHKYCIDDVLVLNRLFNHLRKSGRWNKEAMLNEHQLATWLTEAQRAGIPFDVEAAHSLVGDLLQEREDITKKLIAKYGGWFAPVRAASRITDKEREHICREILFERADDVVDAMSKNPKRWFVPKRSNQKLGYVAGAPSTKIRYVEFNPGSRDHISKVLKDQGWVPDTYTETGKPEVSESTLANIPGAEDFSRMLLIQKRLGQLTSGSQAWLNLLDEENLLHPRILGTGTVTHRAAHRSPNITQVTGVDKPIPCRHLFVPPPGWSMMGADVSGLEIRCLAHYLCPYDGGRYTEWVLRGDVHEEHRKILSRVKEDITRGEAKTWFYAYIYGAGSTKLGQSIDRTLDGEAGSALGKELSRMFEKRIPGLAALKAELKRDVSVGWTNLIDGRQAYIRSEHAALNTKLQGTGAVLCKYWVVSMCEEMERRYGPPVGRNLFESSSQWEKYGDWSLALWAHDETQTFISPNVDHKEAMTVATTTIEALEERFKLGCSLTGEAKIGRNWAETH